MSRKAKTEQYAVAFIDFLGVKDMIANDTSGELLIVFRAACKSALHMCKKILNDQDEITIKMFSDNIVMCKRVYNPVTRQDDPEGALKRVILAASMFQYFILDTMGALVRGGVTIGDLYIDYMMVWGQALVDAYRMESEIALYPRIILDPKLAGSEICAPFVEDEALKLDDDGIYYLNYIHTVWKFRRLKSYSDEIDQLAEKSRSGHIDVSDGTIASKHAWQQNYLENMRLSWSQTEDPKEHENIEPETPEREAAEISDTVIGQDAPENEEKA